MTLAELVEGGIPPDPDQVVLMKCCYRGCGITDHHEPLVVAFVAGKIATFCSLHYFALTQKEVSP